MTYFVLLLSSYTKIPKELNKLQLGSEINEHLSAKLRRCFVPVCPQCLISASGA